MNGRVLSQCNLDELKNEMNMNFGDWQLFRALVRPCAARLIPFESVFNDFCHAVAPSQINTSAPRGFVCLLVEDLVRHKKKKRFNSAKSPR